MKNTRYTINIGADELPDIFTKATEDGAAVLITARSFEEAADLYRQAEQREETTA